MSRVLKRTLLAVAACTVLLLVVGGMGGRVLWQRLHDPYRASGQGEIFVVVQPGSGTAIIGQQLITAGVVRDELLFRAALWWTDGARSLQAGEYRFLAPEAPVDVVGRLVRGDVHRRLLTFPEGLTVAEMAEVFEARGFGTASAFLEAAGNTALVGDLDTDATDLEGYLFPDTYALPRGTPAATLVTLMVREFREAFSPDLQRNAEAQGLTAREVVTLASLVEKETGQAAERPIVSAVYRNRLEGRMLMQADPTVVYALRLAGQYDGNIRREDLDLDSPYNTYRYPGLPPGPIASPGAASLRAVLEPADVPFLYFVSRNDGSHAFARTLAEHNRNVREFQVEFFRGRR
jgi:UPF0755 protein